MGIPDPNRTSRLVSCLSIDLIGSTKAGLELTTAQLDRFNRSLVLLCYKNWRRQQGHLGRERARWVAIWRRRVAMECGLCRSVLIGSATRFGTVWQAG